MLDPLTRLADREGSTRTVALIRIGLVLVAWSRWAGVLAPWAAHSGAARLLGASFFVASALLLVGLGSRIAAAWLGATLLAMHYRPDLAGEPTHYHTYLLAAAIALLATTPCGRSFSVDRWLAVRRGARAGLAPPPERGPLWGLTLIALQVSALYFWSALDKSCLAWLSGMRLEQVILLYYTGYRVPNLHVLAIALSIATVAIEYTLAVGLWFRAPAGSCCPPASRSTPRSTSRSRSRPSPPRWQSSISHFSRRRSSIHNIDLWRVFVTLMIPGSSGEEQEAEELGAIRTAAGKTITKPAEITTFLAANGIEFATWGTDRVPKSVTSKTLSPEEKQQILDLYKPEIDALISRRGYVTADMVSLSPETPNLTGIMTTFKKEHYHTDDEVRFVAAGRGIFYIRGVDGQIFECEVHPGDLIVVPANTWHYFDLCADSNIACVRVFKTKDGWVANFKPESKSATA